MSERHDYTFVALYTRVSSYRQDVDLSVSAQMRALRDCDGKTGTSSPASTWTEAESGHIAGRPEFRRMIGAASKTDAPFREILVGILPLHQKTRACRCNRLPLQSTHVHAGGWSLHQLGRSAMTAP